MLAAGSVAVITEHFQREHGAHVLVALARAPCRNEAAHLRAEKVRHLLVRKGDKLDRQLHRGELDEHGDGRGVVVSAGRAWNCVVMRADDDRSGLRGLNVAYRASAAFEVLRFGRTECALDVPCRGFEIYIPFALREHGDVAAQALGQRVALVGERRQWPRMGTARHCRHIESKAYQESNYC